MRAAEHTWSDVGVDGKSTQTNSQLIYVTYPCFVTSEQKKLRCTFPPPPKVLEHVHVRKGSLGSTEQKNAAFSPNQEL